MDRGWIIRGGGETHYLPIGFGGDKTMHTFCLSCCIDSSTFQFLLQQLNEISKQKDGDYATTSYSALGFTEIRIREYSYRDKQTGQRFKKYYLMLRCNLGTIMEQSGIFALDLNAFSVDEITAAIQEKIKAVLPLRLANLHQMDISFWKTERADLAADIHVPNPLLMTAMLNKSFPYGYCNMKPYISKKGAVQKLESCYFFNNSRTVNIYGKLGELNAHRAYLDDDETENVSDVLRAELQLKKKAAINVFRNKKTGKRDIRNFLNPDFAYGYLECEVLNIFGKEPYICRSAALGRIRQSRFKPSEQTVMAEIIQAIDDYKDLYHLEKAIAAGQAPPEFGSLKDFRKMLKKIRSLGFNPATLPDCLAGTKYAELTSLYELLQQSRTASTAANG